MPAVLCWQAIEDKDLEKRKVLKTVMKRKVLKTVMKRRKVLKTVMKRRKVLKTVMKRKVLKTVMKRKVLKTVMKGKVLKTVMKQVDRSFTIIFIVEMIIKQSAYGFKKYFTDAWCWLDFVIVAVYCRDLLLLLRLPLLSVFLLTSLLFGNLVRISWDCCSRL